MAALAVVVTGEGVVENVVVSGTDTVVESAVVVSAVVDEAEVTVMLPDDVVFSGGETIVDGVVSDVVDGEAVEVDHDVVLTTGVIVNDDVVVSDDNVLGVSAIKIKGY